MSARRPTSPAESSKPSGQHVAIGAGANGQHFGDQAGPLELVDDESGGAMLVVSDLRMGVDVPPDGDQPLVESGCLPRNLCATRGVGVGHGHRAQSFTLSSCQRETFRVVTRHSHPIEELLAQSRLEPAYFVVARRGKNASAHWSTIVGVGDLGWVARCTCGAVGSLPPRLTPLMSRMRFAGSGGDPRRADRRQG